MSSCCAPEEPEQKDDCCGGEPAKKSRPDPLLWSTLVLVSIAYLIDLFAANTIASWTSLSSMIEAIRHLMDSMWIGLALGMFFVGVLGRVPREFVTSLLGKGDTFVGILRATFAGVLLDLCSHGILLVAMRLYQRGASLGQVMAFLIASPWNSLSLLLSLAGSGPYSLLCARWLLALSVV